MSEAYEIVKTHYAASDRGDLEGMLAPLAENCAWTEAAGFPCAGTYIGPEEVKKNVFFALGDLFDNFTFTLNQLLDAGQHVVGVGLYAATAKSTGKSFEARVTHVWEVEEGKVVKFEQFADTKLVADALKP
ncbi:hypothetical protein ATL17_3167 [Maritalea mobilis]|uniref:SnoaL-like domain-containing protein n=1 Tax=Maritalea mobilis TaxID=483324 RepID=A0A4R6VHJ9_9HYPH|nr:nuclear transport factor 2 family protein [Maritalea mobilis]TDQ62063.1 hypothetical protein ATL17_3167 [Maritalea mobilis]